MARRKRRSKKRSTSKKYLILSVLIGILLILIAVFGFILYHLGYESCVKEAKSSAYTRMQALKKKEHEALQKYLESKPSEIEDYEKNAASSSIASSISQASSSSQQSSKAKLAKIKKPKLIIIIDDVAYGYQVKALKNLGLKLNLSFFPPSSRHRYTPKYAKTLYHYMIHLPLEANHYYNEEEVTLRVHSSTKEMEKFIAKIRKNFPRAKFINNHTGSKFTANYTAIKRLVRVLRKYGFIFVDSRTTPYTQVAKVMREFGYPYIARNIFLDNEANVSYIQNQLKKAIHIAKRKGIAIAIGHPREATIKALAKSKAILKEVQLIYIDEYY